jgi:hypothetical protein
MVTPLRKSWWREAIVVDAALALGMVGLRVVSGYRTAEVREQTPEIVHGRLIKTVAGSGSRLGVERSLLVALPDGSARYLSLRDRDDRGCEVGSRVALEQRGASFMLAPIACPDARAGDR